MRRSLRGDGRNAVKRIGRGEEEHEGVCARRQREHRGVAIVHVIDVDCVHRSRFVELEVSAHHRCFRGIGDVIKRAEETVAQINAHLLRVAYVAESNVDTRKERCGINTRRGVALHLVRNINTRQPLAGLVVKRAVKVVRINAQYAPRRCERWSKLSEHLANKGSAHCARVKTSPRACARE